MEISVEHLHSQTIRARELTFLEKVHHPPPVMFHMAHIMCHVYIYNNKKNVSLFMDNITQEQLVCGDSHIICVLIEVTQLFQATATVANSW